MIGTAREARRSGLGARTLIAHSLTILTIL